MDLVNVPVKFEVRSFSPSWDNRGTQNNLCSPWIRLRSLFSKICNGLLFGWTLWMYLPNLEFVALPVPEIIAVAVLGWGCEPPILGKGRPQGSGMVSFERALVSSYRPTIVTFHLSLRVSETLPLLCSSTQFFPIPSLVSPKFPHVLVGVGGWPSGYKVRRWDNCPCN